MLMQVEHHIRWSQDKLGAIKIFNRRGESKEAAIKSAAGIEIWKSIAGVGLRTAVSLSDLLKRMEELFGQQQTRAALEQDTREFVGQLRVAGIIRILADDGSGEYSAADEDTV
jgi:hypothetical protein